MCHLHLKLCTPAGAAVLRIPAKLLGVLAFEVDQQAEQQLAKEKPPKENRAPAKSQDFVGRGETTERADFGHEMAEGAERSLVRRKEVSHDR